MSSSLQRKRESQLLEPCLKLLRTELGPKAPAGPGPVIIKHADLFTAGGPDVSITWRVARKMTSWWEFKTGERIVWENGLQQLTCRRLAVTGYCWVVLYEQIENTRRTVILTPDEVEVEAVKGFDHEFVLDFIWRTHAA